MGEAFRILESHILLNEKARDIARKRRRRREPDPSVAKSEFLGLFGEFVECCMAIRHRTLFVFDHVVFDHVLEKHSPVSPNLAEANLFLSEEFQASSSFSAPCAIHNPEPTARAHEDYRLPSRCLLRSQRLFPMRGGEPFIEGLSVYMEQFRAPPTKYGEGNP
jgi:hypothetical protein